MNALGSSLIDVAVVAPMRDVPGSDKRVHDRVLAAAFPSTHLETSGMTSPAMLRRAVSEVGADRILFGSDYLFWHPVVERARVENAGLDQTSTRLIMGENAARLLDLQPG